MKYVISYEQNPSQENLELGGIQIMEYAKQKKGHEPIQFFAFFLREQGATSEEKAQGSCLGCSLYGCLHIDELWVTESLRGQGYGSELVKKAEMFGREKGCTFSTVNTMDWEALDFYKKLGYYVEFERLGFHKNSIFYFLRKELTL